MLQGLEGPWSEAPPCGLQGVCERRNAQGLPKEEVLCACEGSSVRGGREGRVAGADATPPVTALTGEGGKNKCGISSC